MNTSNSKTKAKAFLGAAFVLLIALLFTGCPQKAKPKPKHTITFSVDGTGGTLKAQADGIAETEKSPISVEEGKTVTFTAKANDGYQVKGWTLDGKPITEAGTKAEYKLTVTKAATVSVSFELIPETAILTLNPNKLNIIVKAKTADGKLIEVEGCTETTFASDENAELHATGTVVTLRGKITKLECLNNQLVALNVQGCTSLQKLLCRKNKLTSLNVQGCTALKDIQCQANQLTGLDIQGLTALEKLLCNSNQLTSLNVQGCTALKDIQCQANQLNADVFKKLFIDLPACKSSDYAEAILYTEEDGANEGNHKDFTNPPELKAAFDDAKSKNWTLMKKKPDGTEEDI